MNAVGLRSRAHRFARLAALVAVALTGLTCRDSSVTGPGLPSRTNLAIAPRFEVVDGGPSIVLHQARAELFRLPGGSLAGSAVGTFAPDGSDLEMSLSVLLTQAEETFVLRIAATNANGDTVFRSVDSSVVLRRGLLAGEPVPVVLTYSGADALAVSLATSPEDTTMDIGTSATFRAVAKKADSSVVAAPVGWRSSDSTKLQVTDEGVATALSGFTGLWLFARTATGLVDSSRVSAVRPVGSVVISPAGSQVIIGRTLQMTASVRASDLTELPGRVVTWSSSDASIATVSQTGLVTGVVTGTVTITARSGGVDGTTTVTVIVAPVATVEIAPRDTTVFVGDTLTMRRILRDDQGVVIPVRPVLWTSLDPTVAQVNQTTGFVTAVGEGIARIVATSEGRAGQTSLFVVKKTAAIAVASVTGTYGGTVTLRATLTYQGAPLAGKTLTFVLAATVVGSAVTDANGVATLPNVSLGSLAPGTYGPTPITPRGIDVDFVGDAAFRFVTASAQLIIQPAPATLTLGNLSHVFDGSPKAATVTTTPLGLAGVSITYNGSAALPVNAGSYAVTATLVNANYSAAPVNGTLVISQSAQSISFAALPNRTYGEPPFTVSATSSSGLAVTFAAAGSCSVDTNSGLVTISATGVCTITATQAGNGNFAAATPVSQSFTVNPGQAALTLGNLSHVYDGSAKAASVTTTPAGLTGVTITYNGSTQLPVDVGSYSVVATLVNSNYSAAPANGTLVISQASASLTFGPNTATYDGTPKGIAVSTTPMGLSGVSVTYNGSSTLPTGVGAYTVVATLANANYAAAPLNGTFYIQHAPATLTLGNLDHVYDGSPKSATVATVPAELATVTITYNGSTVLPVNAGSYAVVATLSNPSYLATPDSATLVIAPAQAILTLGSLTHVYDGGVKAATVVTSPADLGVITITYNGGSLLPVNAGSYAVVATLSNTNYTAGPASETLVISQAQQSITIDPISDKAEGDQPFQVQAVSTSLLPLTYSVAGSCSNTGATVFIEGAGVCTVTVSQGGDANYAPAQTQSTTFSIRATALTQSIIPGFIPERSFSVGSAPLVLTDSASSGLPVTYDANGACTRDGSTISFTRAGICTVNTNQPGGSGYAPAPEYTRSFTVSKGTATLAFDETTFDADGSPKPVTVTTDPVGLSGVTVTYNGEETAPSEPGTYTIVASLSNPDYVAISIEGTLTINGVQQAQTITFDPGIPTTRTYGDPSPVDVKATSTSGLVVSLNVVSGNCGFDGGLYIFGAGTCEVVATQDGDASFLPAEPVTLVITTLQGQATISVTDQFHYRDGTEKSPTVSVSPQFLQPTITYEGTEPRVEVGDYPFIVTIDDPNYFAEPVKDTLRIRNRVQTEKASQFIEFPGLDPNPITFGDPMPPLNATASSQLPVSYSYSGVCTVDGKGGSIITGPGTCFITASQQGDERYYAATPVQQELIVLDPDGKVAHGLTVDTPGPMTYNDPPYFVQARTESGAPWRISNASGACSDAANGSVKFDFGITGTCFVTVTADADETHYAANASMQFEVISPDGPPKVVGMQVVPATATIQVNDSVRLEARLYGDNESQVSGEVSWSTSDGNVVITVDPDNSQFATVTGTSEGTATILASHQDFTDNSVITVQLDPPSVTSVQVTPNPGTIEEGGTVAMTARSLDQNGNPIIGEGFFWSPSDGSVTIALVGEGSNNALVRGFTAGSYTITACSAEGPCGTSTLVVTRPAITWLGGANRQWQDPANWSGGVVPTIADSAVVPDTDNDPMLITNATVGALELRPGAQLDVGAYSISIDRWLDAGTTIVGGTSGTVKLIGTTTFVRGKMTHLEVVSGTAYLSGKVEVTGWMSVLAAGTIYMQGNTLSIADTLGVSGRLKMFANADTVTVGGNARFSGTQNLDLRGGVLRLRGNLNATGAFSADNVHEILFDGNGSTGRQNFNVLAGNGVQNVRLRNPVGVNFNSNARVRGNLTIDTGAVTFAGTTSQVDGTITPIKSELSTFGGTLTLAQGLSILFTGALNGPGTVRVVGPFSSAAGSNVNVNVLQLDHASGTTDSYGNFMPPTLATGGVDVAITGGLNYTNLNVGGASARFVGNDTIAGSVSFTGTSILKTNGQHVRVLGNVSLYRLSMASDADTLDVVGTFNLGGGATGDIVAGVLRVGGTFSPSTADFTASGTHKVILNGTVRQTVNKSLVGDFQDLVVENPRGVLLNAVNVKDSLIVAANIDSITVSGAATFRGAVTPARLIWHINNGATATFLAPWTVEGSGRVFANPGASPSGTLVMRNTLSTQAGSEVRPGSVHLWDVSGTTGVEGLFTPTTLVMAGPALAKQVHVDLGFTDLSVTGGSAAFVNGGTIPGAISVSTGAKLLVNGRHVIAASLTANGPLGMYASADTLEILGNATFRQSAANGSDYTAGVLMVKGTFDADVCCGPYFVASGSHKVVLNGTTASQSVRMGGAQNFQHLELANVNGATLKSVDVRGDFTITPALSGNLSFTSDNNSSPSELRGFVSPVATTWSIANGATVKVFDELSLLAGSRVTGLGTLLTRGTLIAAAGSTIDPAIVNIGHVSGTANVEATFTPALTRFQGPVANKQMKATLGYKAVTIDSGSVRIIGNRTPGVIDGNLTITANPGSYLDLFGEVMTVTGNLDSWGLRMADAGGALTIQGNALFQRADSSADFTEGVLAVAGNFTATVPAGPAFTANSNHTVILNGTGRQNVNLVGYQHFATLEIANTNPDSTMGVHFVGTRARVERKLTLLTDAKVYVASGKMLDACSNATSVDLEMDTGSLIFIDEAPTAGNLEYFRISRNLGTIVGPTSTCPGPPS